MYQTRPAITTAATRKIQGHVGRFVHDLLKQLAEEIAATGKGYGPYPGADDVEAQEFEMVDPVDAEHDGSDVAHSIYKAEAENQGGFVLADQAFRPIRVPGKFGETGQHGGAFIFSQQKHELVA